MYETIYIWFERCGNKKYFLIPFLHLSCPQFHHNMYKKNKMFNSHWVYVLAVKHICLVN